MSIGKPVEISRIVRHIYSQPLLITQFPKLLSMKGFQDTKDYHNAFTERFGRITERDIIRIRYFPELHYYYYLSVTSAKRVLLLYWFGYTRDFLFLLALWKYNQLLKE